MRLKYLMIILLVLAVALVFLYSGFLSTPTGDVVLDVPQDKVLASSTVLETADTEMKEVKNAAVAEKEPVRVSIQEDGFFPAKITIAPGQKVIWKNDRKRLKSLVMGVRELIEMRSEFLLPEKEFSWTFEKEGEFDYMDGVTIGREGKIVVEELWR